MLRALRLGTWALLLRDRHALNYPNCSSAQLHEVAWQSLPQWELEPLVAAAAKNTHSLWAISGRPSEPGHLGVRSTRTAAGRPGKPLRDCSSILLPAQVLLRGRLGI